MKPVPLRAIAVATHLMLAACAGGDVDAPSPRDPSSPRAPEASFDAGPNPLAATLPPPPSSTSESAPAGHRHGGGGKAH